jgi:hypothetical protein
LEEDTITAEDTDAEAVEFFGIDWHGYEIQKKFKKRYTIENQI